MGISRELAVLVDAAELVKPRPADRPKFARAAAGLCAIRRHAIPSRPLFLRRHRRGPLPVRDFGLARLRVLLRPGEYTLRNDDTVGKYQVDQIHGMEFAPAAELYLTDAGAEEDAKGIDSVSDSYGLSVATEASVWRLTFRAETERAECSLCRFRAR